MDFTTIFNQLSNNQKCLIINTMVHMEHCTPICNINIIHGIKHGRLLKGLSEKDMITQLTKIYKEEFNIFDNNFSVANTYNSMIKRNSRNSNLYPIILDFLEIDEDIITTCYFSSLNATELFSSLSSRNQSAILYIMQNLDSDFSINLTSRNIGIQEEIF